jgi:hypothetical protein
MNAMQNQRQASLLKLTSHLFLSMFAMVLLFSCSKDNVESLDVIKNEASTNQSSQSNGNSTTDIPFDLTIFVPCANGGSGEWVELTGSTNLKYSFTWTDHGFTYGYHANTYVITGVGQSTGEKFVGSGSTDGNVFAAWVNNQWIATFSDKLRIIGQNTRFFLKNSYHVTVTPDNEPKADLEKQESECN